jgi:hypothetical protein
MSRKAKSIVLLLTRPGSVYGVNSLLEWYTLTRASGQCLSTLGAWDAIADAVRHRVTHFQSLRLRNRLFKALVSFDLVPFMKKVFSDRMAWFGIAAWWHDTVVVPYKAPILKKLDEVDVMIADVDRSMTAKDEASLLRLLQAMEDLEEQVALVPTEVQLERSEKEASRAKPDKFPKRVRGWTKLIRKFRRAYQNAQHH